MRVGFSISVEATRGRGMVVVVVLVVQGLFFC